MHLRANHFSYRIPKHFNIEITNTKPKPSKHNLNQTKNKTMKNLKLTSLLFLMGIFTTTIAVGQSTQSIDYDAKIATIEKDMENSGLTVEEFDKKVAEIERLVNEKEKGYMIVGNFIMKLNPEKHQKTETPDNTKDDSFFIRTLDEINSYLKDNRMDDLMFAMVLEEINKEYNLYDKLITKGYDSSTPLATKAKEFNDNQGSASTEYIKFKENYIAWMTVDTDEENEENPEE